MSDEHCTSPGGASHNRAAPERAVAVSAIRLMQGVVYQETDAWDDLVRHQGAVRNHFAVVGLEVVIDDDEGYAYLRTADTPEGEDVLPRAIRRRSLTYADSSPPLPEDGAGPHRRRPAGVSGDYWSASTCPRASAEMS